VNPAMTGAWFRSRDETDPAWHQWRDKHYAICGMAAHPDLPWLPWPPRGGVICADCED